MIRSLIGKLVLASEDDDDGNEFDVVGIIFEERGAEYHVAWTDNYTGWYDKYKINTFRKNLREKRRD
jgi:hypothetical protein